MVFSMLGADVAGAQPAGPVRVQVEGVDEKLAARALADSALEELDCDAAPWAVGLRVGRVERALSEGLRTRGHHAPIFVRRRAREDDCWSVTLGVDPGPRTRLRKVNIRLDGEGTADLADIVADSGLAAGTVLDESAYEALKRRLHDRALSLGYFEARLRTHRIDVYADEGVADVELVFDTGARHRVSRLDLTVTPDALDPALVTRLAAWRAGEPYSLDSVARLRQRLQGSGYVESIDIRTRTAAENTVELEADIRLQRRHSVTGGVGYATDIGPRAELGYQDRYRNRSGHQTGFELRTSPVFTSLRGEYRLPLPGGGDPWLVLESARTRERTDTVQADAITAAARRVHAGPFDTRMTEFVEFSRERFEVATDDETARLVVVGASVNRSRRLTLEPLELGWRTHVELRGAAAPLSTTDFLQARLEGELALPVGEQSRVILRAVGGATLTPSIGQLPASVRFFAGGDRSIRGYGLDDLGPLDLNGEVRGGRHLLVTSLELERVVRGRWSAAAFVDTGGAFNDFDDPWSTGVGLGVRWRSPLGPVRADLAVPLDDPTRQLRLHVGIGTLFR